MKSERKVRRVLVPVYLATWVESDDPLHAEVLAVESLRGVTFTGSFGAVERVAMHSIITSLTPDS